MNFKVKTDMESLLTSSYLLFFPYKDENSIIVEVVLTNVLTNYLFQLKISTTHLLLDELFLFNKSSLNQQTTKKKLKIVSLLPLTNKNFS